MKRLEADNVRLFTDTMSIHSLKNYMHHAYRQIDQIERRVLKGEVIPHAEKVFSLFEPHTEWIMKGKAKAPVELGKRVCVLEDQFGFILHHQVMDNEADSQVAVSMIKAIQAKVSHLSSCRFDKAFYSPENKRILSQWLDRVILPKKGRLTKEESQEVSTLEYIHFRYQHAAIESAINA